MMWDKIESIQSSNELVKKYIFTKADAVAESVLYRYPTYDKRTVICCSTQSGCPVGCRFCGAGDSFIRSFTTEEIISQPFKLLQDVDKYTGIEANTIERLQIMFMSMGEPMLNLKALIPAIDELYLLYPNAALLISTSAPDVNYEPLFCISERISTIGLQFSVHESTDEARNKLIPFKAKLTLEQIRQKGKEFFKRTGRQAFFNYCVHDKNNTELDAARLANLFDPQAFQATVSVICERDELVSVAHERQRSLADDFRLKLMNWGFQTRTFDPAGQDDIGGGCGQLKYVQQWMREHKDLARPSVGFGLPVVHCPQ